MSKTTKRYEGEELDVVEDRPDEAPVMLTCKQDVADCLRLSMYKLETLLRRYPFTDSGVAGKLCGRWHVTREDVFAWFRYVQRQELRHPDARRMRPEEPPAVAGIVGRG